MESLPRRQRHQELRHWPGQRRQQCSPRPAGLRRQRPHQHQRGGGHRPEPAQLGAFRHRARRAGHRQPAGRGRFVRRRWRVYQKPGGRWHHVQLRPGGQRWPRCTDRQRRAQPWLLQYRHQHTEHRHRPRRHPGGQPRHRCVQLHLPDRHRHLDHRTHRLHRQ
ncbi:hypothetical protein D3C76_1087410 [compost metagenome]